MSLYSGVKVNHIGMNEMADMVIEALGQYYEHSGTRGWELRELFNPLRTDYAYLTNQKWDQDQASEKIINACMSRIKLAQVRDGNTVLVDLSGANVSYDEVWERIRRDEEEEMNRLEDETHEKCRTDGVAKCLRIFEPEWMNKVTPEEKKNMSQDESL